MVQAATTYVPGVCNINTKEIARRKKAGYFGLVLTLVLAGLLFGLDVNRYFRILLFVPLFIAAIGFLQAKYKFCVGYGGAGLQNADEASDGASKVADKTALQKDKQRTRAINTQALVISLLATILAIFI